MVALQISVLGFGLVFLVLAILTPLVLYAFVRSEHDSQQTMTRADGERIARRDSRNERR